MELFLFFVSLLSTLTGKNNYFYPYLIYNLSFMLYNENKSNNLFLSKYFTFHKRDIVLYIELYSFETSQRYNEQRGRVESISI